MKTYIFKLNDFKNLLNILNFDINNNFYELEKYLKNKNLYLIKNIESINLDLEEINKHKYNCCTYPWSLEIYRFFDFLKHRMDEYIWIDIVCIDQNSKNIVEDLKMLPLVYKNSQNHFILTCKCFERAWCTYEIMIYNQTIKFLSLSKKLTKRPKSFFLLSNEDFQKLLDLYCAKENISLEKRNTLKDLNIEKEYFEEICNKMKKLSSFRNNFHLRDKKINKKIIEEFNNNIKQISFLLSKCYNEKDKTEIEKSILNLCSLNDFDLFLQHLFVDKLDKFLTRITKTDTIIKSIVVGTISSTVTLTLLGSPLLGAIGPVIGTAIGASYSINKKINKTKEI